MARQHQGQVPEADGRYGEAGTGGSRDSQQLRVQTLPGGPRKVTGEGTWRQVDNPVQLCQQMSPRPPAACVAAPGYASETGHPQS